MLKAHISGDTVTFIGSMTMDRIDEIHADLHLAIEEWEEDTLIFDLSGVDRIDSAGVVFIDELQEKAESKKIRLKFLHVPDHVREATELFTSRGMAPAPEPARPVFFERLGDFAFHTGSVVHAFLFLIADTFYY